MRGNQVTRLFIIFSLFIDYIYCYNLYMKIRLGKQFENVGIRDHLKFRKMKKICGSRDLICANSGVSICAIRIINQTEEFQEFQNSCYLFLSNMCDNPGTEFFLVSDISCPQYVQTRRHDLIQTNMQGMANRTVIVANGTKQLILREVTTKKSRLPSSNLGFKTYDIENAFDYHDCPHVCPDSYEPVCINVNRQMGKYFKLLHFINHCRGDMFYCEHYEEFKPPPQASSERISVSNLGWSFCAAFKYMQFARFSEVTSSMSHYGWLHGDQRYTKILDPEERAPGYGRKRK